MPHNGAPKADRTLLEEWAYVRLYRDNARRAALLPAWLHVYNHHRCHTALGGLPPIARVNTIWELQLVAYRRSEEVIAELSSLADAERVCCPFLDWNVQVVANEVQLLLQPSVGTQAGDEETVLQCAHHFALAQGADAS